MDGKVIVRQRDFTQSSGSSYFAVCYFKLLIGLCDEVKAVIKKFCWGQKGGVEKDPLEEVGGPL